MIMNTPFCGMSKSLRRLFLLSTVIRSDFLLTDVLLLAAFSPSLNAKIQLGHYRLSIHG
jgi:hypothetical protein